MQSCQAVLADRTAFGQGHRPTGDRLGKARGHPSRERGFEKQILKKNLLFFLFWVKKSYNSTRVQKGPEPTICRRAPPILT